MPRMKTPFGEIASGFPGTDITLHVHEGMQLRELSDNHRDSYSYQIADIFYGRGISTKLWKKTTPPLWKRSTFASTAKGSARHE